MNSPAERLLARLEGVRPNGRDRWMARCPAHQDGSPSLSIREAEDGKVLLRCFAECDTGDVLAAIGLTFRDLFVDNPESRTGLGSRHHLNSRQRAVLEHERDVLAIAMADLDAGRELSPGDAQRAFLARHRIDRLRGV